MCMLQHGSGAPPPETRRRAVTGLEKWQCLGLQCIIGHHLHGAVEQQLHLRGELVVEDVVLRAHLRGQFSFTSVSHSGLSLYGGLELSSVLVSYSVMWLYGGLYGRLCGRIRAGILYDGAKLPWGAHAEVLAHGVAVLDDVEAADHRRSPVRRDQAGEQAHGRRLARACRGTWARVTVDNFRYLALQNCTGHRASTNTGHGASTNIISTRRCGRACRRSCSRRSRGRGRPPRRRRACPWRPSRPRSRPSSPSTARPTQRVRKPTQRLVCHCHGHLGRELEWKTPIFCARAAPVRGQRAP
jgi:hypothetical protein